MTRPRSRLDRRDRNVDAMRESVMTKVDGAPDSELAHDGRFDRAARDAWRAQASTIPAYAAYLLHLGVNPNETASWREIPPVPTSAFKSHDLSAAPLGSEVVTFETSGTTISKPGRVRLSSTAAYEESLLRSFAAHVLPDD